jgi:hypothetical protein
MEWWLWILAIALLLVTLASGAIVTQARRRRGRVLVVDDLRERRNR